MENLKTILADKILDLSSGSGEEMKLKATKIQRFRDFANACQSLMVKYPQIEEELIKMLNEDDFDTKVASSRVDAIIRLADKEAPKTTAAEKNIAKELEAGTENPLQELEKAEDAADYLNSQELRAEETVSVEDITTLASEEEKTHKRKIIIRRIIQIGCIVIAAVLLFFIIKFVANNWQAILILLGMVAAISLLAWYLMRKRK